MVRSNDVTSRRTVRWGDRQWTAEVDDGSVSLDGVDGAFTVSHEPEDRLRVVHAGGTVTGAAAVNGETVWVGVDGHVLELTVAAVDSRSRTSAASRSSRGHETLTPPMSATVVRILVKPGDRVHAGDTLIVLEAMKMELPMRAPHDAVIDKVLCREGELVQPDTVLIDLK